MPQHRLIEVTRASHGVEIDLVYASERNLTGKPIYRAERCLLLEPAEACLREAIALAASAGVNLKIFDAYRPPEVQRALWEFLPDPTYVADLGLGSNHSRGTAIDLTLVDADGEELDMGTRFDAMTAASSHFYNGHPPHVQRNRLLLLGLMHAAGFVHIESEWWHYELPDSQRFPMIQNDNCGSLRLM
ncbi:D-alanyl-D-alanine dipeptidase [Burkholderia ubonensis]|uniref:D-alanyl-D-alanine dipeptidase n=1 Tax=Burkholderia ubonensis TaxID=101571 RepID=UPI000754E73D|nr:D-alanyl-D-alanine dipeptidase [Burkholderia ubonensis]KVU76490.1 D-alanyl-D-alanine dipeptidase [Burkholderia ubonensis]